jgi:hypothetical protein
MAKRQIVLVFAALVLVRLVVVPLALAQDATRDNDTGLPAERTLLPGNRTVLPGDVRRYHRIATAHGTPYRDFEVEYPPVTLAAIEAIDGGSVRHSTVSLMWSQVVLDLAIAGILAWGWGRRAALAYLVLGLPFLTYPFLYLRLDLLVVLLAVGGMALVRRHVPAAGGVTLAVACFAKLWPLVVLPALFVRREWRALIAAVAAGVVGLSAWMAWVGTSGVEQVLTFRGASGWQIESIYGALVRAFTNGRVHVESGAWRVGAAPDWAKGALTLVMLASLVLVWVAAARAREPGPALLEGLAPLTAIVAFLVFSPIYSPQYACWLVPFAAIAWTGGERALAWLTFTIVAMSTLELFLVKEITLGDFFPLVLVFARNAVLIAMLVVGAARLLALAPRPRLDQAAGVVAARAA